MSTVRTTWRPALLQGSGLLALLLWSQWDAVRSMATLWWTSDTFAHALLVPPIVAWLIWRRREALAALQPAPSALGLAALVAAVGVAVAGRLAEVNVLQHLAVVFSVQALALAVLGARVCMAIAFPLAFLLFAPPFGDFLVEPMMLHTADFTVGAIRLLGIPVFREGLHFVIPSGHWSVVEACSGLRYLFASFMVGTLFAYLNFDRWPHRLGFMLVSLIVPVVANWLRALIIVLLGHFSSNRIATGADHLVYGWVFFGLIMAIMFWIGGRWADAVARRAPASASSASAPASLLTPAALGARSAAASWALALLAAAVLLLPSLWADRLRSFVPHPVDTAGLASWQPAGWQTVTPDGSAPWSPTFVGATWQRQTHWQQTGAAVTLDIAVYPAQRDGAKAVSSVNSLVRADDERWSRQGSQQVEGVTQTRWGLRGQALTQPVHLARRVYWVDGQFTASEREAKLLGLRQLVAGRGDLQAVIVWMTPEDGQGSERLDRFWRDIATPLNERLLQAAREAAGTIPAAAESNAQVRTQ